MEAPHLDISGPEGSKRLPLKGAPITIGRHAQNVLVLADTEASRFHCVIEKGKNGGHVVRDLGSKNGTRLNGQIIKESKLNSEDVIRIGKVQIQYVDPNAPKVSPAPVAANEPVVVEGESILEDLAEAMEEDGVEVIEDEQGLEVVDENIVEVEEEEKVDIGDGDNYEEVLQQLADSLPDKPFGPGQIALINARGKMAHEAVTDGKKKKGDRTSETVDVFRLLLLVCFRIRATDIHVEPKNEDYQVRIRVDGAMVDVVRLNKEIGLRVTSIVKVLSDIDISQRGIVQEGHFSARVPKRRVDYRVSFAPSVYGQKLVVRILDTANTPLHITDLDLPKWMEEELKSTIEQQAGMILVCGPTGSGKTTTLYAAVRDIDSNQRNVVTIEDPVEIQIDGVTQIPVNDAQGNTFSVLLRSMLRQDPDVILVGEVRDAETARIAMQAAMTGHLVFSTVHSRDTMGTVFRLLDLGVEPYLVASGLHVILAQRLVRQLCKFCKKPVKPRPEQLQKMGKIGEGVTKFYEPKGCQRCLGTGHAGRRAVFELLRTNDNLREIIPKSPSISDIQKAMEGTKFESLTQCGFRMVAEGLAAFDEIDKAVAT